MREFLAVKTTQKKAAIMVVDDEAVVVQTIEAILKLETDYDVYAFQSAAEALEALEEFHIDLIVADFLMPGMNGLEFLLEVKRRDPDIVRILLTGYADRENAIKAINEVGLFHYLQKPWDNDQLLLIIQNGLNNRRLARTLTDKINELDKTLLEKAQLAEQHESLKEELSLARRIQESMLPRTLPAAGDISFSACYIPALEVGGDFYDVTTLPDGSVALFVADVTGHGIQAALSTTLLKSAFSEASRQPGGPREILAHMNAVLFRVLPSDIFVAAAVAVVETGFGRVIVANGGLPYPMHIKRSAQTVDRIVSNGLLLGVVAPEVYRPADDVAVELPPGDGILFYTDGVSEVENETGEEFGFSRMRKNLISAVHKTGTELTEHVLADAREFSLENHSWDDVTLVLVDRISSS